MTISSSTNRYSYSGNGVTTAFAYASRFLADADLVVLSVVTATGVSTTKTLTTDYTISGAGDDGGGTVTMLVAPPTGTELVIYGDPAVTQATNWVENDPDSAEVKETAFDKLTLICARLKDLVSRSMKLPDADTSGASVELPTPEPSSLLGWNLSGTAIVNYASSTTAPVTAFMLTVLSAVNAAAARLLLGSAASGANTDITSLSAPELGAATATTQTAGDSSTKVATTAFVAEALLNTCTKIRNGSMMVAQRGTSFTSVGGANNDDAYTLDGWYVLSDGNDIIDVTQETSVVPALGQYAICLDVETVNKKFGIAQIIEARDCNGLIGDTVTFSFKAKVSSTTKLDNVKCAIVSWTGTADVVTSDIVSAWGVEGTNPTLIANATYENTPANLNLTTSYADYSVSALIDTASTKNIILFIWSDVTDTTLGDFLYITDVRSGDNNLTYEQELAWAQRFLPVFAAGEGIDNVLGAGVVATTTIVRIVWSYKRPLRKAPTALLSSNVAHFEVSNGTVRTPTAIAFSTAGVDAAQIAFTVGSALTANTGAYAYAVNTSASLILTGAEL